MLPSIFEFLEGDWWRGKFCPTSLPTTQKSISLLGTLCGVGSEDVGGTDEAGSEVSDWLESIRGAAHPEHQNKQKQPTAITSKSVIFERLSVGAMLKIFTNLL